MKTTTRMLLLAAMVMLAACGVDPETSSVGQSAICQDCAPEEGGGDWVEIPIPSAGAAHTNYYSTYTAEPAKCYSYSGNGPTGGLKTCRLCAGEVAPGCGNHGGGCYYFCSVCTGDVAAGDTTCGIASVYR